MSVKAAYCPSTYCVWYPAGLTLVACPTGSCHPGVRARAGGVRIWLQRWVERPISTVSGTCAIEAIVCAGDGVCLGIFAPLVGTFGGPAGSRRGSMKGCEFLHHLLVEIWLVCVYGLGMLAEIVEAGKLLRAMAVEGAFAGVLSQGRCKYKECLV